MLIVRLARAVPRRRRRIVSELAAAGAVGISGGVRAIPATPSTARRWIPARVAQ